MPVLRMMNAFRLLIPLVALCLMSACSSYSRVSHQALPRIANSEEQRSVVDAVRSLSDDPVGQLDSLVATARKAFDRLASDSSDESARRDYNFAVARIVEVVDSSGM